MMKKAITTLLAFTLYVACQAQIKVNEFGRTSVGYIYDFPKVQMNVGDSINNSLSTISNGKAALFAHTMPTNGYNFGIAAECLSDSSLSSSSNVCGVYGIAGCASGNWATGVSGRLAGSTNGAGVMGFSSTTPNGSLASGKYAGYFVGNVFSSGSVSAPRFLTPSDTRLKKDISYIGENGGSAEILSKMMDVNVISYQLNSPFYESESYPSANTSKRYGVSAQELQQLFPDLVIEGQDGYLAVDYVELIPMLICSVQQLQRELADLRGNENYKKALSPTREKEETFENLFNECALYQNTPNPANTQTTIRYKLPREATDAQIYILNLQGTLLMQKAITPMLNSVSIPLDDLNPGIYLYSLIVSGKEIDTKRMIVSK